MRGQRVTVPIGHVHQPLRVPVCDEIRRRIIAGQLPEGERLFEDQLAQDLGVSRNPVREALQTLAHEGFVELEPRRGARVTVVSDVRASELFEVREALEGLVAGLAAARRTDAQLRAIEAVVESGRAALAAGDTTPLPALNTEFHSLLVATSGNELLTETMAGLTHVIEWIYTRRVHERGLWSWEEHAAITRRIADHDRDGARALACEHIRNARDAFFASPPAAPAP